jgi:hypothetical protein
MMNRHESKDQDEEEYIRNLQESYRGNGGAVQSNTAALLESNAATSVQLSPFPPAAGQ